MTQPPTPPNEPGPARPTDRPTPAGRQYPPPGQQPPQASPFPGPPSPESPYSGTPYSGTQYSGTQYSGTQYPPGDPRAAGYAIADEKTWALLTHFLAAAGVLCGGMAGWVMPLITYLTKGQQSPTLRAHAVQALNFNIIWAVIDFVALFILGCGGVFIGLPFLGGLVCIVPLVFNIIAGVKANEGTLYRQPLSYSLIK